MALGMAVVERGKTVEMTLAVRCVRSTNEFGSYFD